jgi:hypothetical protein
MLKAQKGGRSTTNKKAFRRNIEKGYQKQPKHPPTSREPRRAKHPHLQKEEEKEVKPKETPKTLMPSKGQLKLGGGENPLHEIQNGQKIPMSMSNIIIVFTMKIMHK